MLTILLVTTSCFKEVDIHLPKHHPKLVIGSYITVGKKVQATITQTRLANDTLYNLGTLAYVNIVSKGISHQLIHIKDNIYRTNFKAEYNIPYTITASADGFDTVVASDSIPRPTHFTLKKYIPEAYIDNEGYNHSSITINIQDISTERTYYELRLKITGQYDSTIYTYADLSSNDIIVRNEGFVNQTYGKVGLLFSNELISNANKSLTFSFENIVDDELNKIKEVKIELRTISHEYFKYKKRLYLNIENQVGDLWNGTGNPTEAYTNITNGYGIFAGYSQISITKNL